MTPVWRATVVAVSDVPAVTKGRGAWTTVGKDNGRRYYCWVEGSPLDGSNRERDVNYQAVNRGVKAVQARVNVLTGAGLVEDGLFGRKSDAAVRAAQRQLGVADDGIVGPGTAHALWRPVVMWIAGAKGLDFRHVGGIMVHESVEDPGAVGVGTPMDRGLMQINLFYNPAVTVDQAFDLVYAVTFTVDRMRLMWDRYSAKGTALRISCHIADHNNPAKAAAWYKNGTPPDEQIKLYVERVLTRAATY